MSKDETHCRDSRFNSTATVVDYFPSSSQTVPEKDSVDSIIGDKDSGFPLKSSWSLNDPILVVDEVDTKLNTIKSKNQSSFFPISQKRKEMGSVFLMIALVGLNDATIGGNLNEIQGLYDKSDAEISAVFFFNVVGYLTACLASSFITSKIGLRYSLLLAGCFSIAGCLVVSFAPPYPLFLIGLSLLGSGSGTFDSNLTTVISHYESPIVMSIFFGMYGCGALLSPILAGTLLDAGINWNVYYYIPLGIQVILSIAVFPVFKNYIPPQDEPDLSLPMDSLTLKSESKGDSSVVVNSETAKQKLKKALKMKSVWVGFLLIFIAFGQSDMLTGWICTFLIEERDIELSASRYQLSGYWAGVAIGQIALAFVGKSLNEKTFSLLALAFAALSASIIWLIKNQAVDTVALAFLGLFLGPVTPKIFSVLSARTPASLKGLVMSLLLAVGLIGSCLVPIAFGIVAEHGGLATLPAILMVTCLVAAAGWTLVPKLQAQL